MFGLVTAHPVLGATLTVTNTNDSGAGSLRQAIIDAGSGDTINFDPSVAGTISLGSGALAIDKSLTIEGPGADLLTVNGNGDNPAFTVSSGVTATISGLAMTQGGGINGGGIYNDGNLTLDLVQITASGASNGGGIYNDAGATLVISNSSITGNQATGSSSPGASGGGGIYNLGSLTVSTSLIASNTTPQYGAGLLNFDSGTATLTNTTVSDNHSNLAGGGIYNDDNGGAGSANSVSLTSVTVTNNQSGSQGGGLANNGSVTLQETILGANTAATGSGAYDDCSALNGQDINSKGYNLIGQPASSDPQACTMTGDTTGNQFGVNPQLGPLDSYGGPTQTRYPVVGSPVIGAGGPTCPAADNGVDQRNVPRPVGVLCDVGAVQTGAPFAVTNTDDSGLGTLRQAIDDSNAFGYANLNDELGWGSSTIAFAIPGSGVHTIKPSDALPDISQSVTIDGWSQGGSDYAGSPLIEIDGQNSAADYGLDIYTGDVNIRGLAINNFADGYGIGIVTGFNSWIYGNYIGTDPTGMVAKPNGLGGVWVGAEATGTVIGTAAVSPSASQRNVISGNTGNGILIQSGSDIVSGNYIGVGSDGSTSLPNTGDGISFQGNGSNNYVGIFPVVAPTSVSSTSGPSSVASTSSVSSASTQPADLVGNVIANNGAAGVEVGSGTSGNAIRGNSIYGNTSLDIRLDENANNSVTPPTLTSASSSGNTTNAVGSVTSSPNSNVRIELFASDTCAAGGNGPGQTYLGFADVVTGESGSANFTVQVPMAIPASSTVVTATMTDAGNNTSEFSTCLTPTIPNDAWTRAKLLTLGGTSNPLVTETTASQAITSQGESLWYKVQIQPGSTVAVTLTNLPASYQLALYKDIGQAYQQFNSPTDLEHLSAEFAPDAFSPDAFSPDAFSPDAFSPDAFSPDAFSPDAFSPDAFSPDAFSPDAFSPDAFSPDAFSPDAFSPDAFSPDPSAYTGAQLQSLLAVSAFPGNASQGVLVRTWENTGDFYIRVRGQNGAFDPSQQFTLTVIQQNLNCSALQQVTTPTSLKATAGNYQTLVLTDFSRLPGSSADKTTLQQELAKFIARPEVKGTVVDVSADARVADANAKADANISCPIAKNYVAESIEDIVNEYRVANPDLKYVVIVGSDGVIPFYRYPDDALLANETGFSPPVSDSSSSQASLRDGYILTEDLYGSSVSLSLQANQFPVAGLAVGRLVETASEATGMIDAYLSTNGGVVPITHPSLVTGYNFMQPSATQVGSILQDASGQTTDSLLEMNPLPPTDPTAWTATQLKQAFLGSRHDLVYLAGHFSSGSALAADYQTRMLTTDVTSSALDMTNEIIFSAGCHSGYNTVNSDGIPDVTWEPSWPEAFAEKRATLIAGTGYQYGDTDFTKYSDLLYVDFAQQLAAGTAGQPVSLGQALVGAKQYYLANTPQLTGINQKAVLETTLYGLPMLAVNLPNRTPVPTPQSFATPSLATTNPGQTLGLSVDNISVGQTLTTNSKTLTDTSGNSYTANYLTASNVTVNGASGLATTDTLNSPTQPVLPLVVLNANPTNNPNAPGPPPVLRGVGFRGGTYTDTPNVLPLTSAPATELNAAHATFQSSVFYPVVPWSVNYLQSLVSGGNGATRLGITPAQYISSSSDPSSYTATQRSYSEMSFSLFYSNNTSSYNGNVPALAAPPAITNVSSTVSGSTITFQAQVTGAPSAGIQEVWVTYTGAASGDPDYGKWQSIDLTQSATDSTVWSGSITVTSPEDIRFMVQAANGVGLVSLDTNIGAYFTAGVNPVPPSNPRTSTTMTAAASTATINPSSGAYGTKPTFTATLTSGGTPLSGQTVTFALSGQRHRVLTGQNGVASTTFNLVQLPNPTTPYDVQVSYAGNDTYGPSSVAIPITVTKQATSLCIAQGTGTTPCSSTVPITTQFGAPISATATLTDASGNPLANKTLFFVISNNAGTVFAQTSETDYLGRAQLGPVTLAAGAQSSSGYTLTASFGGTITAPNGQQATLTDPNYANSKQSTPFTMTGGPARAYYTGTTNVFTATPTSKTVTVSLSATIKDLAALSPNPPSGSAAGDIRGATVTFQNPNTSPPTVLCTAPVGLVSATNTLVGTATCNATLAVKAGGNTQYTVEVVVGGDYTNKDQTDGNNRAVITISRSIFPDVIATSGNLKLSRSAGQYAGDAGSRANVNVRVWYVPRGVSMGGSASITVHSQGHVYQIETTTLTDLGVNIAARPTTTTLQSQAEIIDITNSRKPVVIDNAATLQLDMSGSVVRPSSVGITVWNKKGGLYFSSNWNGTTTVQQALNG